MLVREMRLYVIILKTLDVFFSLVMQAYCLLLVVHCSNSALELHCYRIIKTFVDLRIQQNCETSTPIAILSPKRELSNILLSQQDPPYSQKSHGRCTE